MRTPSLLAGLLCSLLVAPTAWAAVADPVKVESGQLSGTSTDTASVRVFKGIPFAAPPTGENRWKAPQPAAKWDGVRKADAFGAPCLGNVGGGRGGGRAGGRGAAAPAAPGAAPAAQAPAAAPTAPPVPTTPREPASSEDCLYANVWTSANGASDRRPVMVWIYGGAFTGGSGGNTWYDGANLAAKGAVVVTFNYRLGLFGFFAHPELAKESGRNASGNYGVMDAIAMMQWVKKNISAFGGDPNNVTLFGESAGAIMIGALVGSPQSKGLFHRAINQSGTWMGVVGNRMASGAQAMTNGAAALEKMGVKSIAELRARPVAELAGVPTAGLIVDGYLFPEDLSITFANGKQNAVDVLAGSNKDEATFGICPAVTTADAFKGQAEKSHGDQAAAFLKLYPVGGDADAPATAITACGDNASWNARQYAAAQAKKGKKAYAYFFTRVPLQADGSPSARGATHTAEISYAFNNPKGQASQNWNDVDRQLAIVMSSYWVNFATKGDPNGSGLPNWPQLKDVTKDKAMVLGDTVQLETAVPVEKMTFYIAAHQKRIKEIK